MNTNDQNPSIPAFARGGVSRSDTAELRLQAPRQLLAVFDAVSIARDKERYELILEELQKIADRWTHEATLIHRVLRGNPTLSDTDGVNGNG